MKATLFIFPIGLLLTNSTEAKKQNIRNLHQ